MSEITWNQPLPILTTSCIIDNGPKYSFICPKYALHIRCICESKLCACSFPSNIPRVFHVEATCLQTCHVYSTLKRRAFKHTTCIPRWSDVKTTVSTSLQREIHVVCLLALKRPSKIHSGAFEIFNNVPLTPPLSCFVSVLDQSKETDVRYNILSETY